jgi:hypothetical protein
MVLVTLLAFEIGNSVYRLLEERLGYRFYPDSFITFCTLLILLPAIYQNYQHVRQYNKNSIYAGRLLREIVEGTVRILPERPGESAIIYLNLPRTVQSKAVFGLDNYVTFMNTHIDAIDLYCRQMGIPNYYSNTRSVYVDLGYDTVKLSPKAFYDLANAAPFASTLSDREFDVLSKDRKNRVLFLNPTTNQLVDVSGWTYKELAESIAPYRDKLNPPSGSQKYLP